MKIFRYVLKFRIRRKNQASNVLAGFLVEMRELSNLMKVINRFRFFIFETNNYWSIYTNNFIQFRFCVGRTQSFFKRMDEMRKVDIIFLVNP